jgi:hypothetical protein
MIECCISLILLQSRSTIFSRIIWLAVSRFRIGRGGATTIEADHIPRWDRAFPIGGWAGSESNLADTAFRSVIESWPDRSWADCITNTACRDLRRDALAQGLC